MEKRKWTDVSKYSEVIEQMRREGKRRQEIADTLGLDKIQIKNWINRHNRAQEKASKGIFPKTKGRPRKKALTRIEACEREISRLEMENKLLRDFLRSTERM